MLKIVITGPESSGKTTLTQQLSKILDIEWHPEYARAYLDTLGRSYVQADLAKMVKYISSSIQKMEDEKNTSVLLLDTYLLVFQIWSTYKYGNCEDYILNQVTNHPPDLYLLCTPDIPWAPDPQRENPNDRDELFNIYEATIKGSKVPYVRIQGTSKERLDTAQAAVNQLLSS